MSEKGKSGFFAEFKKFISRGNVLDMAVGIIIGAAFTAIVQSFVNDMILPVIAIFTGGVDFVDLKVAIRAATEGDPGLYISYGKFIQAIVNFLLISLIIFTVVRAFNKMREASEKAKAEAAAKEAAAAQEAAVAPAPAPAPVDEKLEALKAIKALLEKQQKA